MKMLYIKISLCFTYLLQKCMPTNHLNADNNAPMGFHQRGVSVHSPLGARASRPLKWRPRWPRSQEKAGGSERLQRGKGATGVFRRFGNVFC